MRIYEVIGVKFCVPQPSPIMIYAARNEEEVSMISMMIQDQGGLPMVHEVEVPDDFDQFALDLPSTAYVDPCLN